RARGVTAIGKAFGGMDDLTGCAARFSPVSNNRPPGMVDELRILISTDTLSEGQNLQDAHIVVNFDLPWAIIRLVQRAGRVDRIGQQAREILCYSFLPAGGIENIINLRRRLQQRIRQSATLIGSDEEFFEGDTVDLKQVYEETINLDGTEDETDLISRAYDIWRQAVKNDPGLESTIRRLPDVVYAAKCAADRGAIAYIKTRHNQHTLARINDAGEVVSMSQSKMLAQLACAPDEPRAQPAAHHHDLVAAAVRHVKEGHAGLGGQLGGQNSIRHRVYNKMKFHLQALSDSVFDSQALRKAVDLIYNHPLKETARDRLVRQLRAGIENDELAAMVVRLAAEDELCAMPKAGEPDEPRIICSMGLVE
ncbi:MAG: C-terminal helicase domain-containing protein, partial [Gammaproteobacteria bacterium]|nr:C-terminal helicase domain-containing protein [Gammaproteobacteria bacterium]